MAAICGLSVVYQQHHVVQAAISGHAQHYDVKLDRRRWLQHFAFITNWNYYFTIPQMLLFYFNYYFILFYPIVNSILFLFCSYLHWLLSGTLTFTWYINFTLPLNLKSSYNFIYLSFCVKRTDMFALDALYKNKTLSLSLSKCRQSGILPLISVRGLVFCFCSWYLPGKSISIREKSVLGMG